jgi:uncharacterized membrane protein
MQNSQPPAMPAGKTQIGLQENVAATLCYLTILLCGLGLIVSLVLFLIEKSSRFVRFHSMQALLFGAVGVVVLIAFKILYGFLNFASMGILDLVLFLVELLVILILLLALILAAIKSYQGQYYKLPVIGGIAWNVIDKPSM